MSGDTAAEGRLEAALRARRDAGAKLLVPYVTGGLRADWLDVLRAMVDAGADAVEVGIPFSDPVMDGPTIQQASAAALARGTTPMSILADLRGVDVGVPLVAMTYVNLVFRAGARRFAAEMAAAGLSGIVLPDLPLEEQDPWLAAAEPAGIATVQLAGPITPDGRLKQLCERAAGFVYGVNLMGVTGERAELGEQSATLARRLEAATDVPVLMGFGVSTPQQAVEVAAPADGVIVASAIMRRVLDGGTPADAGAFVSSLREALDE
jgi:tryptophan synthase alpha chain